MRASMTWLVMYAARSNTFMLTKVHLELIRSFNCYGHACMYSLTKKVVMALSKNTGLNSCYKYTHSQT